MQRMLQTGYDHWQVLLHGLPDDIEIDVEIRVNEPVSHGNNFLSRDFRRLHPG
jgi:hypothetical protein